MIPRYADQRVDDYASDLAKLLRWDTVELAVLLVKKQLGKISARDYTTIRRCFKQNPPDVAWWKMRDREISHDLNAYVDERRRHLPLRLRHLFHEDMTSYDTEDPAFMEFLALCTRLVDHALNEFDTALVTLARRYQYTIMLERTHGQGAKLRSFGGRVLTWRQELYGPRFMLESAKELLRFARLSGAIGNYGGRLTPEIEQRALKILGRVPFYGATQIIPRTMIAPLAQQLNLICRSIGKIAIDIRLGARSGLPIVQEPFGKSQKGSSAMPHKKNTINTEQMGGMVRLADADTLALVQNADTWEGRAIEQSSVERVAWPDLFHVVLRMLSVMTKVVTDLTVFADHMLREIVESRGTYASEEAKNWLGEKLAPRGVDMEDVYRIVQLASFNVLEPTPAWHALRVEVCAGLTEADGRLSWAEAVARRKPEVDHIRDRIKEARLVPLATGRFDYDVAKVPEWNQKLEELFANPDVRTDWDMIFKPSFLLAHEEYLFEKLLPA